MVDFKLPSLELAVQALVGIIQRVLASIDSYRDKLPDELGPALDAAEAELTKVLGAATDPALKAALMAAIVEAIRTGKGPNEFDHTFLQ